MNLTTLVIRVIRYNIFIFDTIYFRLTAVCVAERMADLKMMLQVQGPVIHDNNLHPNPPGKTLHITLVDIC